VALDGEVGIEYVSFDYETSIDVVLATALEPRSYPLKEDKDLVVHVDRHLIGCSKGLEQDGEECCVP
jgi:hypothetical protein